MPRADAVYRPCPCCGGSGRFEVTGAYREAYDLLRAQPGEATGAALAKLAGCEGTATNNRLAALERFGLAVSRRWGRERLYRAVRPDGEG